MRKSRFKIFAVLLLTLTIVMVQGVNIYAETEDVTPLSKAALLYEATTDTIIYEKNKDMQLPPASMTKVMTAIIILEDNPELKGTITVSPKALDNYYCSWIDDKTHLEVGEEISCYNCMKYMLLFSANEATTAFAFSMYDDIHDFVDRMNEKAKELGCENTHFSDTSGLSSSNVTTPEDMVKMCMEAMKNEKFREIVKSEKDVLPVSNKRDKATPYETYLRPIYPDDERYESPYSKHITGIKTGWIPASGYCYSASLEKDGYKFYSVVMGAEETEVNGKWAQGDFVDTLNLFKLTDNFQPPEKNKPYIFFAIGGIIGACLITIVFVKKRK